MYIDTRQLPQDPELQCSDSIINWNPSLSFHLPFIIPWQDSVKTFRQILQPHSNSRAHGHPGAQRIRVVGALLFTGRSIDQTVQETNYIHSTLAHTTISKVLRTFRSSMQLILWLRCLRLQRSPGLGRLGRLDGEPER